MYLRLAAFSLFSVRCVVSLFTFSAWERQSAPMRNSGRTGAAAGVAFAMFVDESIRKPK